jgi:cyclase
MRATPSAVTHALGGAPARFPGGLREVAPRTWAWLQPNGGLGESNAGLVVGHGASLLVDTLWDEPLTRRMLDAMAPLLADAPLRRAFVTHPDGDHWWGNAVLDASVEIVATAACDRAMRGEAPPRTLAGMARLAGLLRHAPGHIGGVAKRAHTQTSPFEFGEVRRRYADRVLATTETVTVGERGAGGAAAAAMTLDAGGRSLRVLDVGPTHTAADAVVHVPDEGVVFAADILFVGVTPIMWHGPVDTWLRALETLLALDAGVYVPGHGPPCGRAEVERLAGYWRWLQQGVLEQRAAGRSGMDAARALVRSPEHAQWNDWEGPERIVVNVATIERNLDGGPAEVKPPVRARLLLQTVALGHELS